MDTQGVSLLESLLLTTGPSSNRYCLKTSCAANHKVHIFPSSLFDVNSLSHFLTQLTGVQGQPTQQDAPTEVCGHSWPALG